MNKGKKLLFGLLFITIVSGSLYYLYMKKAGRSELTIYKSNQNPAEAQVLTNDSSKNKKMSLKATGIYEVTTVAMADTAVASTDSIIPPQGVVFSGIYISKDETVEIPAKSTVQFTPVKLELLGSKKTFTLSKLGNYYIGSQIAPGNYRVFYVDESQSEPTQIQLILSSKKEEEQTVELNKNCSSANLKLKEGTLLSLKSDSFAIEVTFERKD